MAGRKAAAPQATTKTDPKPKKVSKARAAALAMPADDGGTSDGGDEQEADPKERTRWTRGMELGIVTTISDNPAIQNSLFPPAKMATQGRKLKDANTLPKESAYWGLIDGTLKESEEYKAIWPSIASDAQKRKQWVNKTKGKLRKMVKTVNEWRETLGKTGEGLHSKDEVDTTKPNRFTNLHDACMADCPYFWELRNIIAERPNHVPQGVGNNSSAIDMSALQPQQPDLGTPSSADECPAPSEAGSPGPAEYDGHHEQSDADELRTEGISDDEAHSEPRETTIITHHSPNTAHPPIAVLPPDSDSDVEFPTEVSLPTSTTVTKRKAKDAATAAPATTKKTKLSTSGKGPKSRKSTPAAIPQGKGKAGPAEKLRDIGLAEEETERARLELDRVKVVAAADVKIAELKSKDKRKEAKAKYKLAELELKYKYKMAKAQTHLSSSSSDPSVTGPSTPYPSQFDSHLMPTPDRDAPFMPSFGAADDAFDGGEVQSWLDGT
ncbi:hypothetical protein BD626DRAFT_477104 [Schizophyllum amplum]|uniref:No apical meristem-associated C-terminal domain-containing protein n=1 Tax=Schizophyllum amplum TaxID=97359 RepID=A0A550CZW6_9AGAR|nr:hypothetical protein BD626DRAFT_531197 [Auriculariopsis ampla]TRM70338.1 hypothetical protein BD626DRAFT_477104 [Auriculariopsis ampla]